MSAFSPNAGPILLAHRGARRVAPENSLEAFEAALLAGADGLETDVRCSADGEVVIAHDADGRRVARIDRVIAELGYDELRAWDIGSGEDVVRGNGPVRMPTLAAALHAFPSAPFNVDIKAHAPAVVDAVLRVVTRAEAARRVLLTSFSTSVLRQVRARGYRGPSGLARLEAIESVLLGRLAPHGAQRLQIPERWGVLPLDNRMVIDRAHELGLRVDYWVVNDPARAEQLLALGADGIVSDDPAALSEVVARHRRKA